MVDVLHRPPRDRDECSRRHLGSRFEHRHGRVSDGGAMWTYRGTADISYGKDAHPDDYTYWAPEVIWLGHLSHVSQLRARIFTDWNHPREIVHLTSKDGVKWNTIGTVDLNSDRAIDACVIQLTNGTWRMWYKTNAPRNRFLTRTART